MFTGYFTRLKNYQKANLTPISIAAKAPIWYKGDEYKKLAPKWSFYSEWKNGSHKGDNDYYTKHFKEEVLDKLDPEQFSIPSVALGSVFHPLKSFFEPSLATIITPDIFCRIVPTCSLSL